MSGTPDARPPGPWPRYTVEIDEEGYPMFEGIRVQDENLNRILLGNLRRVKELRHEPVVTLCEGELCWVNAFDAPWVALQAERVGPGRIRIRMPAGVETEAALEIFELDEWDRLHVYAGPDRIPAVLSRAAQASLLQELDRAGELGNWQPRRFREGASEVESAAFWNKVYDEGRDSWERKGPVPKLVESWTRVERRLLEASLVGRAPRILLPAAGRAHDAVFFETNGCEATALDFSSRAVEAFRALYPLSRVRYESCDLFYFFASTAHAFEGVFEVAAYCAVAPSRRRAYLDGVSRVLVPGGLFFGVFFLGTREGGPPFGMTQWELREATRASFDILEWSWMPPVQGGEALWAVLRRKSDAP